MFPSELYIMSFVLTGCRDCFGRVPFGSLIAAILVCVGVGLFCGTLNRALHITIVQIFEGIFYYPVPW